MRRQVTTLTRSSSSSISRKPSSQRCSIKAAPAKHGCERVEQPSPSQPTVSIARTTAESHLRLSKKLKMPPHKSTSCKISITKMLINKKAIIGKTMVAKVPQIKAVKSRTKPGSRVKWHPPQRRSRTWLPSNLRPSSKNYSEHPSQRTSSKINRNTAVILTARTVALA